MKKKGIQLIFSFLTLCVCSEIQGQEDSKKAKGTFNGSISLNYDFTNNFTGNINLGYNRKNWDLYMDYSGHSDRIEISSELSRYFHDNKIFQSIETEQHHLSHLINLQINLHPSTRNLFLWDFKVHLPKITTNQEIGDNEHNRIAFARKTFETSLAYKHIFEQDRQELSLNGTFSYTKDSHPSKYHVNHNIVHVSNSKEIPRFIHLQMDYIESLSDKGHLETGIKFFSRWNKINYIREESPEENSNHSPSREVLNHDEYIFSPYLFYSAQAGKQFHYKIGLQADYDDTGHFYPYPLLAVSYSLADNQQLAFRFTRQSTRPDYTQLTPSLTYIDRVTFEQGNPTLRPEIMNRAEINHSYSGKQIQVNSTLYFNATEKFISPVYSFTPDNSLLLSYMNGIIQNEIGLDIEIPFEPTPWLTVHPAFSFTHTHSSGKSGDIDLHTNAFCWNSDWRITIIPRKYMEFQANFRYRSPTKVPQFKLEEDYYLDLSVRQGFLGDRLQISFSVTDVFDTSEWNIHSLKGQHYLQNYSKEATHAYWIGLTFHFNSYKPQQIVDDPHPVKRSSVRLGQ